MDMQGRTVMITGAAGSLGRAVAEAFYATGATLALVDLQMEALQKTYPGKNPRRILLAANLTDAASAAQVVKQAGKVDALCNIAGGFTMGTPVHATPAADWQKMWDINAVTMLNMVQAVVPGMLAAGGGRIVNIGAGAGQKGAALMGAYSVSKSAVIRMTEAMSAELREQGINVNCVLPSIIDTPPNRAAMPDADPKKWVAPADLASVILFLCSDSARAVHGAALPVVGLS
ncbi:MAG TPA: SDR family NAD(P)-dependent oxidoreductase [Solimonas sp.]|nr:SDR family NAD(P)-dependent oxidoreductase [Solimonas sp.]